MGATYRGWEVWTPWRGNSLESHIQSGRIAGLMPHDESPKPWGIQTDIVAVGGSGGSPILRS